MTSSPSPRAEGLLVSGRFRVRRKLGSGSTGTVYLAEDVSASRSVALKVLKVERLGPKALNQLQAEFRAIAGLRHPQIARAYDFGYTDSGHLPFYTREYIEGVPLQSGPPDVRGNVDPRAFLRPILDLLDALHYLHAHEILHLDIHSGNLIVADDSKKGSVLIDFGLGIPGITRQSSELAGTRSSLPPELLLAEPPGPAADIHSVGRTLLFRLTGHYEGDGRLPREIPGWGSRLTLELERIVGKALQPDPAQRFPSALEFRERLLEAVGGERRRSTLAEPGELTLGRQVELKLLDGALQRADSGQAALVWISGPRGSGKSRLLTETRWRAQLRGLSVVDLPFLPEGGSAPAFERILRSLRGAGQGEASWLSPLDRDHGGSSSDRAKRSAAAYFAEAGASLVLLFDDLEHADRESRLLAESLMSECVRRRSGTPPKRGLAVIVTSAAPPPRGLLGPHAKTFSRALRPLPLTTSRSLLKTLLRPLHAPQPVLARLAREAQGNPLRLRQLARALHAEYGSSGRIPAGAPLPTWSGRLGKSPGRKEWRDPHHLEVVAVLAALQRPSPKEEIAAASELPQSTVEAVLRQLKRDEVVASSRQGRVRLYYLVDPAAFDDEFPGLSGQELSRMHGRIAAHLEKIRGPSPRQLESLARHLLAAKRVTRGRQVALEAAAHLRRSGLLDNAVRLLESALRAGNDRRWRFRIAEEISEIHREAGDHLEGIAVLEPVYRAEAKSLTGRAAVRLRRRLGVHYHRAGQPEKAIRLFREARSLADPGRDREELIFLFSELAEIYTFRGEYGRAESSCRAGLDLLRHGARASPAFRARMEVTLRASLGHLELRRMALERAREEFTSALSLARSAGRRADQALIYNNLGIVHNQLNNFPTAERCFRQAERFLVAAGERRTLIQTACNLAVIAAKRGKAATARDEMERASRLLREHPGERLEFFVGMSKALTDHLLGRTNSAADGFRKALPLGRRLGDEYLVRFGEVYLAEAYLACGHYQEAFKTLNTSLALARRRNSPLVVRMVASRLLVLERLSGRKKAATLALKIFEETPRTRIGLLEAWNDFFLALGDWISGSGELAPFDASLRAFQALGVPSGVRLARVGLLFVALSRKESAKVRFLLTQLERESDDTHKFLAVLEPLARAEASFFLGELDRCSTCLQQAAAGIVGFPFLELEWRIDFLRSRLAEAQEDREAARHYLHRSLQARDLLLRSLPSNWRQALLAHPRFAQLEELGKRLERHVATIATPSAHRRSSLPGLVGRSSPMLRLLEHLERLRDLDLPGLIVGETGTGKELVAKAIHQMSTRRRGPFWSLHAASLPEELFESELFGYEAGAFTGAEESRQGLLEHFRSGTLLLDEITLLSPSTQAKLLQVMDSKTVRPLGSLETHPVDVRLLTTSSVNPKEAVATGALRQDFYYRLRAVEIHVPPLRERREDIPLLMRHFLERHGRRLERIPPAVSPETIACLSGYHWPGNVRELETLAVRLLVDTSPGRTVEPRTIERLLARKGEDPVFPDEILAGRNLKELRAELDKAYLLHLFRATEGDIQKMLKKLGIKRSNLYTWFRKLGIDVRELRRRMSEGD